MSQLSEEMKARLAARDAHVRESWVRSMEARIVRDMLQECHRVEGVNHYEKCQDLADRYTSMLADSRVKGYKQVDTTF
ncbi:unnamed protein product [Peniophora sp. CBMAI 1063]|nr:unnamed protein product [Peniophora sp. CBMAI 1063]